MPGKRVIVKVGGSVLDGEAAYAETASALSGYLRREPEIERLYVVVSAQKGVTDRAIATLAPHPAARRCLRGSLAGEPPPRAALECWDRPRRALALLWGEIESAFHLAERLALEGRRAAVVTQLGLYPLVARGSYLHAKLDLDGSRRRFERFDRAHRRSGIVILPGFGAANSRGEPALFGRNASDYVAAALSALDPAVGLVVFVKDAGALYEGFATGAPRKIAETGAARLRAAEFGQVLDRRVLEVIACDFRVVGRDIRDGGTMIRLDRAA